MNTRLKRWLPPGVDWRMERGWLIGAFIAAFLYSLLAVGRILSAVNRLYRVRGGVRYLIQGALMEDYVVVLDDGLKGFLLVAVAMIALAGYHYAYHFQGSRSIYLMRRLPNRWELWRRCLTVPVVAALSALAAAGVLLVLYYLFYVWLTPTECLVPGQWARLWNTWMGGILC